MFFSSSSSFFLPKLKLLLIHSEIHHCFLWISGGEIGGQIDFAGLPQILLSLRGAFGNIFSKTSPVFYLALLSIDC